MPPENESENHSGKFRIEPIWVPKNWINFHLFHDNSREVPVGVQIEDTHDCVTVCLLVLSGVKGHYIMALF
jgi:hypothetical protein